MDVWVSSHPVLKRFPTVNTVSSVHCYSQQEWENTCGFSCSSTLLARPPSGQVPSVTGSNKEPDVTYNDEYPTDFDETNRTTYDVPIEAGVNVIGGEQATHGDFPHQVRLQATNQKNRHFCGASIIHSRFLLSAAHCFVGAQYQLPHVRAVAGEHDLKASAGNREQVRQVTRLIRHENYDKETFDNDIALLELDKPFNFNSDYVRPIRLRNSKLTLPQSANVSGWGKLYGSDSVGSERLMAAQLDFLDHDECKRMYGNFGRHFTSNMICAGGLLKSCQGDSGGPLTCSKDLTNGQRQTYLCGIVSWGDEGCSPDKYLPTVYTDVTKYEEWIHRTIPLRVYGGTEGGEGILELSVHSQQIRTLVKSTEDLEGLTFDWISSKLYFATTGIYAANANGAVFQTVFESTDYGGIEGLAFDWITGNLYGVSRKGHVFACKVLTDGKLRCANLLTGQGDLAGIALDPNNGKMYWTRWRGDGGIMRAQMDGRDAVQIVKNLDHPAGITIDYDASRLYWAEYGAHRICYSSLNGTGIRKALTSPSHVWNPWGIALVNDQMYWGSMGLNILGSTVGFGHTYHIRTWRKSGRRIQQLTTNSLNFPLIRDNPSASQQCENVCVLTTNSSRSVG